MRVINFSADIAAMEAASKIKETVETIVEPVAQEVNGEKKKGWKAKGVQAEEV